MRVPLDAWQVGPWNRWAYVHVDEVGPTSAVPRGSEVWPLEPRTGSLDDLDAPVLAEGYVDGLAVVHDWALVLERYGGEMHEGSVHLSQSVGKPVLGLMVGILVGDGRLDPASRVTDHVPEVAGSGYD